ncbi:16S rRNA (adenine(1518)-N(6)/adenine(1519)-N(6))-dimethyltransferase RsmA [Stella sp.]|uniref:16S rRNA (adenine(1518)-N(6)/adenine(1519)-N(6))- dimethyltransferase RsmA n=1 Tax=Stella sp. TaxID=2912054 RepID=UPI0035B4F71A
MSDPDRPGAPGVLPPLREVIARHGLGARKALGQHFLLDLNLTRRIARAAGPIGEGTVIEIGPGPGGLTRALLECGAGRLVAIERDERCRAALAEVEAAFPGRLEVVMGDALAVDPATVSTAPRRIVANLPYNISTALLLRWLERPGDYAGMVLMFQKEVADRLLARPGDPDYGRLTVLVQWLCRVRRLFDVPASAFVPPPKVTSSVVEIVPRDAPLAPADRPTLERVTQAAFGQRRKMLRASLRPLGGEALLVACGIDPTRRAEELSVEDFARLARHLSP